MIVQILSLVAVVCIVIVSRRNGTAPARHTMHCLLLKKHATAQHEREGTIRTAPTFV
jgi:hypothetical protein